MSNNGAGNLSRFARTAPKWANQVRASWNPAAIEWQTKAITGTNRYAATVHANPSLLPTTPSGYQFVVACWIKPTTSYPLGIWELANGSSPIPIVGIDITLLGGLPKITVQEGFVANHVSGAISPSSWNHIVASINELGCTVFINGIQQTYIGWASPIPMDTWTDFRVGHCQGDVYEGAFSDISTFKNTMASQGDVDVLYNNGAVFNMSQTVTTPINPLIPFMTAIWDGSSAGTTKNISVANSSLGNPTNTSAVLQWSGNLTNVPKKNPNIRPASRSNTYSRLAALASKWAAGVSLDGKTVLGAGFTLETYAPSLLPFPFAGWGFKTDSSSLVGAQELPVATPQLTEANTIQTPQMANNPVAGAGTLQGALDTRPTVVLKPTFAVK